MCSTRRCRFGAIAYGGCLRLRGFAWVARRLSLRSATGRILEHACRSSSKHGTVGHCSPAFPRPIRAATHAPYDKRSVHTPPICKPGLTFHFLGPR